VDVQCTMCEYRTVDVVETMLELGERIREARLAQGLSQGQLADELSVDRSAVVRIESGERRVTALELFRMSEALRVPVGYFTHRSPEAITSRRQALEDDPRRGERDRFRLDAALEAHLRDAELLRSWGYLTPPLDVPRGSAESVESARALARQARSYLGQLAGPLPALASVAERLGLYLLVADLEGEGASLTPEAGFGVAVIGGGAGAAPGRKRSTAAHEVGHHLLGDEYQSDVGVAASRDARERIIDAFAAEFLVPAADVTRQWQSLGKDSWERLVRLAAEYRVSWAAAVRVAVDAGMVDASEADRLRPRTPQLGDFIRLLGAGPVEDLPVGEIGPVWRRAVLESYQDGHITAPRVVEMLHGALTEAELPSVPEPAP